MRVSAQANNERFESEIVRNIMNDRVKSIDYAQSEATTITAAPPKVRLTKDVRMEEEINDLRKELVDAMDARDAQTEALSLQRESIAALRGQVAKLSKLMDRHSDESYAEISKATKEILALKTLVKLYI